jgi:hypothetical protein
VDLPESGIPWDKEMHSVLDEIRTRLRSEYEKQSREYTQSLFHAIFPTEETPTCVIKYRVSQDPADSNIYGIQYFAYWPVQLFPRHLYDYEPVTIIVRKEGKTFQPLLIAFNADYGAQPLLKGKRPGHIIRTFFNWDSQDLQITPSDFNPMVTTALVISITSNVQRAPLPYMYQQNGTHTTFVLLMCCEVKLPFPVNCIH